MYSFFFLFMFFWFWQPRGCKTKKWNHVILLNDLNKKNAIGPIKNLPHLDTPYIVCAIHFVVGPVQLKSDLRMWISWNEFQSISQFSDHKYACKFNTKRCLNSRADMCPWIMDKIPYIIRQLNHLGHKLCLKQLNVSLAVLLEIAIHKMHYQLSWVLGK